MRGSIRGRIGIGLFLITGMLFFLAASNGSAVSSYRHNIQLLTSLRLPQSQLVNTIQAQHAAVMAETLQFLITQDAQHIATRQTAVAQLQASVTLLASFQPSAALADPETERLTSMQREIATTLALTDEMISKQQRNEPLDLTQTTEDLNTATERTQLAIRAFEDALGAALDDARTAAAQDPLVMARIVSAAMLITIVGVFLALSRTVVAPIRHLQGVAALVAGGHVGQKAIVASNDELGDLASAFNLMLERLAAAQVSLQAEVATAEQARRSAEEAQQRSAEQLATIERQQNLIEELSIPILPLTSHTFVMPLIGTLDSKRLTLARDRALTTISAARARYLLLDITGVPVIDAPVAEGLLALVQAARLLGVEVVVVGVRPEVAQAMIALGIPLDDVVTRSSLQSGVAYTLGNRGARAAA